MASAAMAVLRSREDPTRGCAEPEGDGVETETRKKDLKNYYAILN